MFENFCSDIIQTMRCFTLESFNLSCQAEHTKINSGLNINPGLALIAFWTTRPWFVKIYEHNLKKLQFTTQRFDTNHDSARLKLSPPIDDTIKDVVWTLGT